MKRYKKYNKLKNNNDENDLKHKCYRLVDQILAKGEISKADLFAALAFRLRIPIEECYLKNFDDKMLEKALKELKYMLD